MSEEQPAILVEEDDAAFGRLVASELGRRGFGVSSAADGAEALSKLDASDFGVIETDLRMNGVGGLELCQRIAQSHPDVPVIVMTAFGSLEKAVTAMRSGAHDFLMKPFELDELVVRIARAAEQGKVRRELLRLRRLVSRSEAWNELVGKS